MSNKFDLIYMIKYKPIGVFINFLQRYFNNYGLLFP